MADDYHGVVRDKLKAFQRASCDASPLSRHIQVAPNDAHRINYLETIKTYSMFYIQQMKTTFTIICIYTYIDNDDDDCNGFSSWNAFVGCIRVSYSNVTITLIIFTLSLFLPPAPPPPSFSGGWCSTKANSVLPCQISSNAFCWWQAISSSYAHHTYQLIEVHLLRDGLDS